MPTMRLRKVLGKQGTLQAFADLQVGLARGPVPDLIAELQQARSKARRLRSKLAAETSPSRITNRFQRLYHEAAKSGGTWRNTRWMGIPTQKLPLDLWIYQEILHETRPDLIIESGTSSGGSALYLAHVCDALGKGRIITIDIEERPGRPRHDRITYLTGSSTSDEIASEIHREVEDGSTRAMVILDSDHSEAHVAAELSIYWSLVAPGCYLIVEDTVIGHPVRRRRGTEPGPMEAVEKFLRGKGRNRFVPDREREKLMVTFNPKGYLRRVG